MKLGNVPARTVRIDIEQIRAVLVNEVIKREVMEGDKAEEAKRKLSRAAGKSLKASAKENGKEGQEAECKTHQPPVVAAK